jgi:hypothetical protein
MRKKGFGKMKKRQMNGKKIISTKSLKECQGGS